MSDRDESTTTGSGAACCRRPLLFVDIETTGLDPAVDQIWEIAVIRADWHDVDNHDDDMIESGWDLSHSRWLVRHDAALARDRLPRRLMDVYLAEFDVRRALSPAAVRRELLALCDGAPTLVGAMPSFDAGFLQRFLGVAPWHFRLRCVEAMTAGRLGWDPGGLSECLAALGLPPNPAPHTARADVDAAARVYGHLMGIDELQFTHVRQRVIGSVADGAGE